MSRKIQHLRGRETNLPRLNPAEFAFTTDTEKLFVGGARGNIEILTSKHMEGIIEQIGDGGASVDLAPLRESISVLSSTQHSIHINAKYPPQTLEPIKHDGVTNDSVALQAVIDYTHTNGGGIVYLPQGTIRANDLVLKEGVHLVGAHKNLTILLIDEVPGITLESNTSIKNIYVKGNSETFIAPYYGGVQLRNGSNQLIESCKFSHIYSCVYGVRATNYTIKNCDFICNAGWGYGFYGEVVVDSVIEGNEFNCTAEASRPITCQFVSQNSLFLNNRINGNGQAITGILFMNHYDGYDAVSFGNKIIGNTVRNVTEEGISFDMMMNSPEHENQWTGGTVSYASNVLNQSTALVDSSKDWASNKWYLRYVLITKGKGVGQIRQIMGNNTTGLSLNKAWDILPDDTSTYIIGNFGYDNIIAENVVENCGRQGILLYGTVLSTQITNNIVKNCGTNLDTTVYPWSGIGVVSCEANEIRRYRPSLHNTINDNVVKGGKIGIVVCSAPWSGQYTPVMLPSNTIIKNNVVDGAEIGIHVREGTNSIVSTNKIITTTTTILLDENTNTIKCLDNQVAVPIINLGMNNVVADVTDLAKSVINMSEVAVNGKTVGLIPNNPSVDNSPVLRELFTSLDYGSVAIPSGVYHCSTEFNAPMLNKVIKGVPGETILRTTEPILFYLHDSRNVVFEDIVFESTSDSIHNGVITCMHSDLKHITFNRCTFISKTSNGIKIVNENHTTSEFITFNECVFKDIGRMGIEIQNHNDDPWKARYNHIVINKCQFRNIAIEVEHTDGGMAISFTGYGSDITIRDCYFTECLYCAIEIIGAQYVHVEGSTFEGINTPFAPLAVTNWRPNDYITIVNNKSLGTLGNISLYNMKYLIFSDNQFVGVRNLNIRDVTHSKINNNVISIRGNEVYILMFDNSGFNDILNNTLTTESSDVWALIRFYGSNAKNNRVEGNTLLKPNALGATFIDNVSGAQSNFIGTNTFQEKRVTGLSNNMDKLNIEGTVGGANGVSKCSFEVNPNWFTIPLEVDIMCSGISHGGEDRFYANAKVVMWIGSGSGNNPLYEIKNIVEPTNATLTVTKVDNLITISCNVTEFNGVADHRWTASVIGHPDLNLQNLRIFKDA